MRRYTAKNPLPLSEFDLAMARHVRRRIPKDRRYHMFESQMYEKYAEDIGESFEVVQNVATMRGEGIPSQKILDDMNLIQLESDVPCSKCGTVVSRVFYISKILYSE